VYGIPQSDLMEIPLLDFFRKDMKLITCRWYRISLKKAIELMKERMPTIKLMITHRVAT
jgi:hypothetical protein